VSWLWWNVIGLCAGLAVAAAGGLLWGVRGSSGGGAAIAAPVPRRMVLQLTAMTLAIAVIAAGLTLAA